MDGEVEPEVTPGHAAVDHGVVGQFGDNMRGSLGWHPPVPQMRDGEQPG